MPFWKISIILISFSYKTKLLIFPLQVDQWPTLQAFLSKTIDCLLSQSLLQTSLTRDMVMVSPMGYFVEQNK
jgi:hypothetical protein